MTAPVSGPPASGASRGSEQASPVTTAVPVVRREALGTPQVSEEKKTPVEPVRAPSKVVTGASQAIGDAVVTGASKGKEIGEAIATGLAAPRLFGLRPRDASRVDQLITSEVRARLNASRLVRSVDLELDTADLAVTLSGITASEASKAEAVRLASGVQVVFDGQTFKVKAVDATKVKLKAN